MESKTHRLDRFTGGRVRDRKLEAGKDPRHEDDEKRHDREQADAGWGR